MSALLVRPAVDADLAAITRIYAHYVLHTCSTFEADAPSAETMAERRASILAMGLPYLAAELDGHLVGYAYASLYRVRAAYRFTVEDSIYLDPAVTGRGHGSLLMRELIAECERGPWRQMVAVIGDSANLASVALHHRFGFRPVGTLERVGYKFNRWVDTVLMQRELNPAGERL